MLGEMLELVRKAQPAKTLGKGEAERLASLLTAFLRRLRTLNFDSQLSGATGSDLVQDLAAKLFVKLTTAFEPASEKQLASYLVISARHALETRYHAHNGAIPLDATFQLAGKEPSPSARLQEEESAELLAQRLPKLRSALQKLGEADQILLGLWLANPSEEPWDAARLADLLAPPASLNDILVRLMTLDPSRSEADRYLAALLHHRDGKAKWSFQRISELLGAGTPEAVAKRIRGIEERLLREVKGL